jgi:hypothetical protein
VLDVLDEWITTADSWERTKLWNVLTALRGPDTDAVVGSKDFTVVIRRATFPKVAKEVDDNRVGAFTTADFDVRPRVDPFDIKGYNHFVSHVRSAAAAIRLRVEKEVANAKAKEAARGKK